MSLYLPLRRSLWKELASRLKDPARYPAMYIGWEDRGVEGGVEVMPAPRFPDA